LDLVLRWLHILTAISLAGGVLFFPWVLRPALRELGDEPRRQLEGALQQRWARVVMLTSGILLITGLVNAVRLIIGHSFPGGQYHTLVALKLFLALAVFGLSALLAGRSAAAERMRAQGAAWWNVNVALVIVLVCLAGVMKTSERVPKPTRPPAAVGTP
jgi:hypothetical protein